MEAGPCRELADPHPLARKNKEHCMRSPRPWHLLLLLCLSVGVDDKAIFNQQAHRKPQTPAVDTAGGDAKSDYSVASQLSGIAAYMAAQVTRCDFQVFSFGACASGSLPGPKPITGMP